MHQYHATVLAVEDNATAKLVYEAIGKRYGFHVTIVPSCDDALAAIATVRYDLILMDWVLAGASGLECTRLIREREKETGLHIPVIGVTAHAMVGHKEQCLAAGMDDYLSKPFTAAELVEKINLWATKVIQFPAREFGA